MNAVFTTADLYDAHADEVRVAEPGLRSYGGHPRCCGPVATVTAPEDNSKVREALAEAGEGRVLVVDGGGSLCCALLGDRLAAAAASNGWSGVIVWGCLRDSVIVGKTQLGVFALATHPARTVKLSRPVASLASPPRGQLLQERSRGDRTRRVSGLARWNGAWGGFPTVCQPSTVRGRSWSGSWAVHSRKWSRWRLCAAWQGYDQSEDTDLTVNLRVERITL